MESGIRGRSLLGRAIVRRLGLFGSVADAWRAVLFASLLVAGAVIVLTRNPIGQNSDGLMETIISLQRVTVFFWGQDRFANLLPALASFIRDPTTNAVAQLTLRVVCGLLAPLFICLLAAPRHDPAMAWRASMIAGALMLAFLPQSMIFETFIEASPYGTSFALAAASLLALRRAGSAPRGGVTLRIVGLALACAAYAVNMSLVLIAGPLLAGEILLFGSALAMEFAIASVLAVGFTASLMALSSDPGAPTTSFAFARTTTGLAYFGGQLLRKPGYFLLGVSLASLAAPLLGLARRSDDESRRSFAQAALLIATLAASFVAVALSEWVGLNKWHPRYLVPDYILVAALGGVAGIHLIDTCLPRGRVRDGVAWALCAGLLWIGAGRAHPPRNAPHPIVGEAARPLAEAVAGVVVARALDGIVGDYWKVWPAVFQAEQLAHDLGRPAGGVFGISLRGDARLAALTARLLDRGRLTLACIDTGPGYCNALLFQTMKLPETVMRPIWTPETMPDGHVLTFLEIRTSASR